MCSEKHGQSEIRPGSGELSSEGRDQGGDGSVEC